MCALRTISRGKMGAFLVAACFCVPMVAVVFAQDAASDYPNRVIRIVVGFTPGGAPDITARILAPKLSELWKQPVVVENRPGAGSAIAAQYVADAAARRLHADVHHQRARGRAGDQSHVCLRCGEGLRCVHDDVVSAEMDSGGADARREDAARISSRSPNRSRTSSIIRLCGRRQLHAFQPRDVQRRGRHRGAARPVQRTARGADRDHCAAACSMSFRRSARRRAWCATASSIALAVTGKQRLPDFPDVPTVDRGRLSRHFEQTTWTAMLAPARTPRGDRRQAQPGDRRAAEAAGRAEKVGHRSGSIRSPPRRKSFTSILREEIADFTKAARARPTSPRVAKGIVALKTSALPSISAAHSPTCWRSTPKPARSIRRSACRLRPISRPVCSMACARRRSI